MALLCGVASLVWSQRWVAPYVAGKIIRMVFCPMELDMMQWHNLTVIAEETYMTLDEAFTRIQLLLPSV